MPPVCRIPSRQIWNAYVVYQSGVSVAAIARRVYRKLGYTTPDACNTALRREFRRRGYRLRTASQARLLCFVGQTCSGCGCDFHERTAGCGRCNTRHGIYRRKGRPYVEARCGGCGCGYSEVTSGCRACNDRARNGRKRAQASEQPANGLSAGQTAGLGTDSLEVANVG